ncbi:NUDIX hydrolase, partial [Modestobacter sp. VKM Ac-2676]
MAVLGVDGWRGKWVGALLTGRAVELVVLDDAAAVLAVPDVEVVAIDMPIGLSEDGVRACDVAARKLLGAAGSSVFPTPVRGVLATDDYAEARAISRAATDP